MKSTLAACTALQYSRRKSHSTISHDVYCKMSHTRTLCAVIRLDHRGKAHVHHTMRYSTKDENRTPQHDKQTCYARCHTLAHCAQCLGSIIDDRCTCNVHCATARETNIALHNLRSKNAMHDVTRSRVVWSLSARASMECTLAKCTALQYEKITFSLHNLRSKPMLHDVTHSRAAPSVSARPSMKYTLATCIALQYETKIALHNLRSKSVMHDVTHSRAARSVSARSSMTGTLATCTALQYERRK